MNIVNFGRLIKKLRGLNCITQNEMVGLVEASTGGDTGIDTVSISRWENNVIVPSHRRQVEVISSLGHDFSDLVDSEMITVSQKELQNYLVKKLIVDSYWDFSAHNCNVEKLVKREVVNGNIVNYCFIEENCDIPVALISFRFENDSLTKGEKYMVIESLYCVNSVLLLNIIGFFMSLLIKRVIDGVIYKSKNRNSPLNKFVKSIGFKTLDKKEDTYINVLSYSDVLYNKAYFSLASCYNHGIEL
ncbi:hypothetical protein L3V77_24565 [Vibrio sp. DW001]|uniref:hypothetical protein n=1 Tax=Vibrio sp. DW001 TaxID=2912315 RepID=UPI0023AF64A9|nr:hypothetical protein [Vibrio sp. DW001]WED29106.1 hypothetical protein L3V77_24565 [Vibrio sp. DW001]